MKSVRELWPLILFFVIGHLFAFAIDRPLELPFLLQTHYVPEAIFFFLLGRLLKHHRLLFALSLGWMLAVGASLTVLNYLRAGIPLLWGAAVLLLLTACFVFGFLKKR